MSLLKKSVPTSLVWRPKYEASKNKVSYNNKKSTGQPPCRKFLMEFGWSRARQDSKTKKCAPRKLGAYKVMFSVENPSPSFEV